MEYSLGPEIITNPYHITIIWTALNCNLAACYPNIQEEVVQSFKNVLALDSDGEPRLIWLHRPLTWSCDMYRMEDCASHEHNALDHMHCQ